LPSIARTAADEIVLGEFSVLGPIDPQIVGLPEASIIKARDSKPIESVFDLTVVLADMGEKALAQVKRGAVELLTPRMEQAAAEALAAKLTGGRKMRSAAATFPLNLASSWRPHQAVPQVALESYGFRNRQNTICDVARRAQKAFGRSALSPC
jgi:ClpP class serine protease